MGWLEAEFAHRVRQRMLAQMIEEARMQYRGRVKTGADTKGWDFHIDRLEEWKRDEQELWDSQFNKGKKKDDES